MLANALNQGIFATPDTLPARLCGGLDPSLPSGERAEGMWLSINELMPGD
jgi:hypothetical protein